MFDQLAERKSRAEMCKQQAKLAMDLADNALSERNRADYLHLAKEWLKLAGEIEGSLAVSQN